MLFLINLPPSMNANFHISQTAKLNKNIVAPVTVNKDLSVLQVPGLCQNAIFVCGLKIVILLSLHK